MPLPQSERERLKADLLKTAEQLGEHWDCVQIFVSLQKPGDTHCTRLAVGCGNFYARYGQAAEWLQYQQAYVAAKAHADFQSDSKSPGAQ